MIGWTLACNRKACKKSHVTTPLSVNLLERGAEGVKLNCLVHVSHTGQDIHHFGGASTSPALYGGCEEDYLLKDFMDFSQALIEAKNGSLVTREVWPESIRVGVQFPDEHSANTKPYLYMLKGEDRFPLDLSCESIFAEDWKFYKQMAA